ncbi:hypothetical protein NLX83_37225 [Allokutzneria sp. A3M-2-11 16]|uniref:hypothetical protein n=1 Tax=Allokutzneria sp. A3M-2-11 16 TaxID=2962043 RepID=UPI0020B89435|nr:hypothetical protein [Allokutzneria sp. A3M-2-11 16]MCP3804923.1 hypothetical protein [Allokutzneria sp. A3M-2-11 16]
MNPIEQYRRAMTELGAADEVAQVDQRVEGLWAQAVAAAQPALDERTAAGLPPAVTPDLTAPAGLDIGSHLDEIERFITGDVGETPENTWDSPRLLGAVWLGACVFFALVLGLTVRGAAVVPAVVPAIITGLVLLALGPGRVPGWIWAIGLMPLALLMASGSPPSSTELVRAEPQWFLGVVFVVLVHGFARLMRAADEQRLGGLVNKGKTITDSMVIAIARRPLEIEVVACMIGAAYGSDSAVLVLASLVALFKRGALTSAVAAGAGLLIFMVNFPGGDWAHRIVLVAFIAHWVRAMLSAEWKQPLTRTEWIMGRVGRVGLAAVRGAQGILPAPTTWAVSAPQPTRPAQTSKYPDGQFGRHCLNCAGETPHVSGGLSMPYCVQCGSKAAGGGRGDRNFPDYCASCGGTTPHTSRGCVVCGG